MLTHILQNRRFRDLWALRRTKICAAILCCLAVMFFALMIAQVEGASHEMSIAERIEEQNQSVLALEAATARRESMDFFVMTGERNMLLTREVDVQFTTASGIVIASLHVDLLRHPEWIISGLGADGLPHAFVSIDRVRSFVADPLSIPFKQTRSCRLLGSKVDAHGVERAETSCIARSGYSFDHDGFTLALIAALESGSGVMFFSVHLVDGFVTRTHGDIAEAMRLLATGSSNFRGSGDGRKFNVRKALSEHLNNVIVPAGSIFSFNDILGDAVSTKEGWQLALAIFGGTHLRPVPGGGICQASTTLYRAALRAGLPIIQQKNHSLYISYYEANGVGQDATIYPGQQDLQFRNDTGAPLLIQAFADGDEAFVNLYGSDDGRHVTLIGPYFVGAKDPILREASKIVRKNEVVWVRTVAANAGDTQKEVITSKYHALPRNIAKKFYVATEKTRGQSSLVMSSMLPADQSIASQ